MISVLFVINRSLSRRKIRKSQRQEQALHKSRRIRGAAAPGRKKATVES